MLELQLVERQLGVFEEQGDRASFNEEVATYNTRREEARRCLWELTIHREALGFRRNEILKQYYPIPAKRRPFPDSFPSDPPGDASVCRAPGRAGTTPKR